MVKGIFIKPTLLLPSAFLVSLTCAFRSLCSRFSHLYPGRYIANILFTVGVWAFFFFLVSISAKSQLTSNNNYPLVRTPQNVTVNKTLPKNILAPGETMPAVFSKDPTDEEIFRVHFFEEPLVPTEGTALKGENAALVYALAAFSQRTNPDDFTAIKKFLEEYPESRWRGALLANLGIVYERTGYFNAAMDSWQRAWDLMKDQTNHKAKVLADRVVAELLFINAWVGRTEKMEFLLNEVEGRVMEGPGSQRTIAARNAVWEMKNRPGVSYKCGPYALDKMLTAQKSANKAGREKLLEVQSAATGFSLTELDMLAKDVDLNYQMAFRNPGAVVIENSVVHWKLGHYSALRKMEDGYCKCEDATMGAAYGQQFWVSTTALDSSASGYFLVPAGPLPNGWRTVAHDEGDRIFGKGTQPPPSNPGCPEPSGGGGGGGSGGCGMAQFNVYLTTVSLHIFDRPLFYNPPKGPTLSWDVHYIQRDSYQPANFSYSNFGAKWTINWLSYVQDDPNNPLANADVYMKGGGVKTFTSFNNGTQSYTPQLQTNDVLVRVSSSCYELRHPDGSKEIYSRPDGSTVKGRRIFLTQKADMAGNKLEIMYDANLRVIALQDAIGQVTTLQYGNATDIYKITKVTDPFGRTAGFGYDSLGRLTSITDMIGMVSSFKYDLGDFITQMVTPYGATSFFKTDGPSWYRSLEIHYPLGEKERFEFTDNVGLFKEPVAPSSPPMLITNTTLSERNTFFWDKKAMQEAPGDYSKARIYHWLKGSHLSQSSGTIVPFLESMKDPLENRVWFNYEGQISGHIAEDGMSASPSITGRVLDDSTSQFTRFTYDSLGHVTSSTDPSGRTMTYIYDSTNHIDLLEVRQTTNGANELLEKYTYNSQHLRLTARDASGQITRFTYNASGQLLTITNPKKEKTTHVYDGNGYLQTTIGPVAGSTVSFTYDAYGRQRTFTDPEGYTITTDYDALNRPTLITYPDNTTKQIVYDRLDAVHTKDRLGRWSHTIYDSLDRATVMQDALGRIIQFIWCTCGSLVEIIDPLKQVTTFTRDLQSRVIAKTYHDGKSITYKYENTTSRLKEATDAKGQTTIYSYFIDDNLKQVDYLNAQVSTPSVAYTYDAGYNRITSMTDGTGTTNYTYYPVAASQLGANRLASTDGPLANDAIAYTYDSLGRESSRAINGVSSTVNYDALGRVTSATNTLGTFGYSYVNQTSRLSSISLHNGQSTTFSYFNNAGDQQLKQIWHKKSNGTTLSKFDYEYNDEGQITKWIQQRETIDTGYYEMGYDLADQLTSATLKNQNNGSILKRYAYQYDKAGNRTSEQVDDNVTSAAYNALNQLTAQQGGGPMRFKGAVNEFSTVGVLNRNTGDTSFAAVDSASNTFEAFAGVLPGQNNNMFVGARDFSGNNNTKIDRYNIAVGTGINNALSFDDNGNTITTANPAVTYDWDAADRLVKITRGANITEFVYDGLSRRVAEKLNGIVIKRWLWCGTELCEERNAGGGTVIKRFVRQGEQINGTNYYFTRDHLGSVREMTDANGNIRARYDYDPYGRRTKVSGNIDADFGFTGYYFHVSSGLDLTLYRAYNSDFGRWLSRDPLKNAETLEGTNLYFYVSNDPLNKTDLLGLSPNNTKIGCIPGQADWRCFHTPNRPPPPPKCPFNWFLLRRSCDDVTPKTCDDKFTACMIEADAICGNLKGATKAAAPWAPGSEDIVQADCAYFHKNKCLAEKIECKCKEQKNCAQLPKERVPLDAPF